MIGLGRLGRAVVESVVDAGGEVIVEAVRDRVTVAAQIETLEAEPLRELGATDVDAAVVAMGDDFATEVLTVAR